MLQDPDTFTFKTGKDWVTRRGHTGRTEQESLGLDERSLTTEDKVIR